MRRVWDTVSKRAVSISPCALRLPKLVLRHCTAIHKVRSARLLVLPLGAPEAPLPVTTPAGLIAVQHLLVFQLALSLLVRLGHRGADLLPNILGTAHSDGNVQHLIEKGFHHPSWHAALHRRTANQRRPLWAEIALHLGGQLRPRGFPAVRVDHRVALILGDIQPHRRQLGDLMVPRLPSRSHAFQLLRKTAATTAARPRQYRGNQAEPGQAAPGTADGPDVPSARQDGACS